MLLEMAILHSFLLLSIYVHNNTISSLFIHLLMDTSCFNVFPIVNSEVSMFSLFIFLSVLIYWSCKLPNTYFNHKVQIYSCFI